MEFRFENKITVWDMWKLSMRNIYGSLVGIVNAVFSVAIIAFTVRFWNALPIFVRGLLVFCCIIYPVLQPIMVYRRSAQQVATLPKDMVYEINDTGLHISADNQKSHITWKQVRRVIKEKNMIILAIEGGRGYMLTNKALGDQREALWDYLQAKVNN